MNPILKSALEYIDQGICVIPIRPKDKRPLIPWQEFQSRMPTEDELYTWFENHPERNIAVVCGAISGGLVVVDIDGENGLVWTKAHLPITHVYTKTPKNEFTYHCFYRGQGIRNSKPHPEVDIRGDGGYVVAPPSIHPNGGQYELVIVDGAEGWKDLPAFEIANLGLDLSGVKITPTIEPKTEGSRNQSLTQLVGKWCAKGNDPDEILALAQFANSKNIPPLSDKEVFQTVQSVIKTHNKNHPGGMVEIGEGELPEVDFDEPNAAEIPEDLLSPGGLLEEIMKYTDRANAASVPTFALAGAISLIGTVCGQRIMTGTGLRTNMYVVSIGYSGAGKNAACSAIPQILLHSAREAVGPTELASAQALLKWLSSDNHHVTLVCVDELGMLLKGLRYPDSPKADMPRVLTRLFSSTDRPDVKSFADMKLNFTIPYHCLGLYGASTPAEFWKGMSMDDASSGFLARLLIFDSRNHPPRPKETIDSTVPAFLSEEISKLWAIKPPIDAKRGNVSSVPVPYVIPISSEAQWTWRPWADKYFDLRSEFITDTTKSSIYGRAAEHAQKLALIHAASLQGANIINGGEIGTGSIVWATRLIDWLIERMIVNVSESISDNEWHATQKKILKVISVTAKPERPGASIKELKRKIHMPTRLFDDIMATLEQSGKIHRRTFKPERGPEGIIFCVSKVGK